MASPKYEMRAHELFEADNFRIAGDLRRLGRDEAMSFHVVHHDGSRHDRLRPLVVVVHPGDMIEHSIGWGHSPEERTQAEKLRMISQQRQNATAKEIREWREAGYDVAVLHRESCTQFNGKYPSRHANKDLGAELKLSWRHGTVLFGDDLDKAGAWMIEHLDIAHRPHVYLAGAYADPEYGCLTAIGRQIARVIGADRVTVSQHSHISGNERWSPDQP